MTKNIEALNQIITGNCNIKANIINYSGNTWRHNGTLYLNGPCNLGGGGGGAAPVFVQPRRTPVTSQTQIYNQNMTLSPTGYKTLATMEGMKLYYYNDQDSSGETDPSYGNCTYGTGHFVQSGPCGHLFKKPVTEEQVQTMLQQDVAKAENIVRKYVTKVKLSQAKFDSLVCHVFNNGKTPVLNYVDEGQSDSYVMNKLLEYHWSHNAQTHQKENSNGLLKRSEWEAVAFGYNGPFYENLIPPSPTWGQ